MTPKLIIIDDEEDIGNYIADVAEEMGFETVVTTTADEFWPAFSTTRPSVIFLDLMMPDVDGIQFLRLLSEQECAAEIILISGSDTRILKSAERIGHTHGLRMAGVLQKPILIGDLEAILEKVSLGQKTISESELLEAIRSDQMVLHYQPKINLSSKHGWDITACEALVRWNHPEQGLILPDQFIPLAEQTGLISQLTDFVLVTAIKQSRLWQNEGIPIGIAVNISAQLLSELELPDKIWAVMEKYHLNPESLTLEITESAAMADVGLTMDILTRLRLKGFSLSLDDFGTGFSSLVQLHRMPFNEMKIDKSFVMEIGDDNEAKDIIQSIVSLGHNLGLQLCAEGVVTEEALKFLRSLNCDSAQGYLISEPLPADQFSQFIKDSISAKQSSKTFA